MSPQSKAGISPFPSGRISLRQTGSSNAGSHAFTGHRAHLRRFDRAVSGVVAGDGVSDEFSDVLVIRRGTDPKRDGCPRSRVIASPRGAGKPRLKGRRNFAKIVQEAGEPSRRRDPQQFAALGSTLGHRLEMMVQDLPIRAVRLVGQVCIKHRDISGSLKLDRTPRSCIHRGVRGEAHSQSSRKTGEPSMRSTNAWRGIAKTQRT